jgi:microcystin-dependent protein
MGQPYVGEIRMFAGSFAPAGWMLCQGQILPISENETLFNLIGTTYGGDGQSTFGLPNLSSRIPLHMGTGGGASYSLAQTGGEESVTLTTNQIPAHSHPMVSAGTFATTSDPNNGVLAIAPLATTLPYGTDAPLIPLAASAITIAGGSQPHENSQPFLCVNFIISLFGVFPSPT